MKIQYKILLILLLFFSNGFSQDLSLLKKSVQELEQKIPALKRAAQHYQARQAEAYLDKAVEELLNARQFMQQQPARPIEAWKAYRKSKAFVDLASRILIIKPALRLNAEMDKLLMEAENEVGKTNLAEARYMLTRARSFKLEAVKAYRNERFGQAQEFSRVAVYFAEKAIEIAQGAASTPNAAQEYRKVRENLQALLRDISADTGQNNAISTLFNKANQALKQAQIAYENGQTDRALQALQIAERLLYRATDLKQQTSLGRKQRVYSNLQSLEQFISGIENNQIDQNVNGNRRLLKKAKQFLKAAWRDYDNRAYAQAESKIALAQRMANKELKVGPRETSARDSNLEQRLSEINQLLSLQETKVSESNAQFLLVWHKQIKFILKSVKKDIQAGRTAIAYQKLTIAMRLINRAETLLSQPQKSPPGKNQLLERQNQIENSIASLSAYQKENIQLKTILPIMKKLINRSAQALNNGQLELADGILNFVQTQIANLLKEVAN